MPALVRNLGYTGERSSDANLHEASMLSGGTENTQ